ncbi:MAG: phosphotransferase [Woeseiaceae bacterium]|nr:phosphotransferase [Woeseiaceae bacterium]
MLRREPISKKDAAADSRLVALCDWISKIEPIIGADFVPVSVDASFRRYFRLKTEHESFIVMDAPPQEDCLSFVLVAKYFEAMQLNVPHVIESDIENGFLLLSDLGSEQYFDVLKKNPSKVDALYSDAIDALLLMQHRGDVYKSSLPPYNSELLRLELSLFRDWLCGVHLNLEFSDSDENKWQACCDFLIDNALQQKKVFVHRDYHSRNLMVMGDNNPGILDFQDAVVGPFTYDLVSLLKDCYIRWPTDQVRQWALYFYEKLDEAMRRQMSEQQFLTNFELMGVQRHLKAVGIFCRLNHRDDKPIYLGNILYTLNYVVEVTPHYPELDFISELITEKIIPIWDSVK